MLSVENERNCPWSKRHRNIADTIKETFSGHGTPNYFIGNKRSIGAETKQKIQVISGPDSAQTVFPDPKNCKRFYICTEGVYHLQCPVGLVYNVDLGKCDIQTHSDSNYEQKTSTKHGQGLTVFPDMSDDSKLFLCEGQPGHYECSGNLFFDVNYAKCDMLGSLTCRPYPQKTNA
uniref:Chitin-binding type-2 domain-containing protein n=1 Tax=Syphacia muris TaxID=451379 RepID=A0A0N5AGC2_9BILA